MDFPSNSSTICTANSATPKTNNQGDTGTDCFQWVKVYDLSKWVSSCNNPLDTTLYFEGALTKNSLVALS